MKVIYECSICGEEGAPIRRFGSDEEEAIKSLGAGADLVPANGRMNPCCGECLSRPYHAVMLNLRMGVKT